jgi:Mg-chelatase subunit ChlD
MTARKTKTTAKKTTKSTAKKSLNNSTKFVLYNFAGEAKSYYLVERKPLEKNQENLGKPPVAHSIIIIDRSGSMYYDLEQLKEYLLKLLTLDEYLNSQLVITLISYSSVGDVKCHFQRIPISEIMKPNSEYQQEIKKIRVTGLTCISQSLEIAKTLIQEFSKSANDSELTAITLHTDGFANDPSYNSEVRKIESLAQEISKFNVIINTISYSYADFKLLSKLANLGSGNCLQANEIKQVYDSLYQTTNLLSGAVSPPIEEPLIKGYDYQIFVSQTAQKIIGSSNTLKITGLKPEDEGVFYKYRQLSVEEYENLTDIEVAQTDESVFAFVKANLAEGNINTAKYALLSSLDYTLTQAHSKALTNGEIIDFTQDIEQVIFNPKLLKKHEILAQVKVSDKITLLELLEILEQNQKSIIINLKHLDKNYQRKGLKRLQGTRDNEGNLIEPWLKTEEIDGGEYVQMGEFNINRNTATINMLLSRKVKLVTIENEKQISEVAGVLINDLTQYNNYTIVGDGEINVPSLKVKINNAKVFNLLKDKGILELDGVAPEKFDFKSEYEIKFEGLPLVSFNQKYENLDGIFEELVKLQVLASIISAHIKEESDIYSEEQLGELKKHYLSKNLYLNFPTTNEYTNLQEALNSGIVDTRISYKIDLGNSEILNLSKLYSANKFLDRLYEAYNKETGEKIENPTFEVTLDQPIIFGHKTLSKRTKITKVDELMRSIFDDFLGIEKNGTVSEILTEIKAYSLIRLLEAKSQEVTINKDEFVNALTQAKWKLNSYVEKIYRQKICPLVFYIGATGLIPDELNAKAFTADEIKANYPELKISKSEQDGTFFLVGNTLITVYPKNEYYSTGKR